MDENIKKITPMSSSTPITDDTTDETIDPVANELRTRFELLPPDVQKVLTDENYQKTLLDISKKNKLTYEEMGTLEMETTMTLLGMTKPEDYRDEIQTQLKKNDPEIDALVKDVNEKIFAPVRQSLEKLYSAQKDLTSELTSEEKKKDLPPAMYMQPEITPAPKQNITSSIPMDSKITSIEKTVLEKSGVELEAPRPAPVMQAPMSPRVEILRSVENPSKGISSLAESKLAGGNTMTPSKTTDYTVKKPETPVSTTTPTKKMDPYREPLG